MIEKAIASGISASATMRPDKRSPRILPVHWRRYWERDIMKVCYPGAARLCLRSCCRLVWCGFWLSGGSAAGRASRGSHPAPCVSRWAIVGSLANAKLRNPCFAVPARIACALRLVAVFGGRAHRRHQLRHRHPELAHLGAVHDRAVARQVKPVGHIQNMPAGFLWQNDPVTHLYRRSRNPPLRHATDIVGRRAEAAGLAQRDVPGARLLTAVGIGEILAQNAAITVPFARHLRDETVGHPPIWAKDHPFRKDLARKMLLQRKGRCALCILARLLTAETEEPRPHEQRAKDQCQKGGQRAHAGCASVGRRNTSTSAASFRMQGSTA